ncbi:hypothetical protein M409DRAFT_37581 [Zasmidium cellare ATCC 36951]|uniref:AMP-dependent synthetase/ligase domain-containing protein n=1 Tax=Zasmidium cellare ATCC 36951 TaxID=1080233 RepID=A0A6A6C2A4_ZASCE|nr:uncharacterized protein M409DRAFT_37581 [Zasmidium cellare ATCC 36951]KAF2161171.1 hypothetical protein M409DRAFT_37581 [Zasmidium cellare ATCC 36951]
MSNELAIPRKVWENPNPESTVLHHFTRAAEEATGRAFDNYQALHQWSCTHRNEFWRFTFNYFPIVYSGEVPENVVDERARIDSVPKWFKGVKLNFAENILFVGDKNGRPFTSIGKEDDKIACTGVREGSFLEPIRQVTWKELRERVGRLSQAMRAHGVKKGDRVASVASSCLDTLTVFLATTAIGALFSSSSTDMGTGGILDRLTQIRPKFVFIDDLAVYRGKRIDLRPKWKEVAKGLHHIKEFQGFVAQPRFKGSPVDMSSIPKCQSWDSFISRAKSSKLEFEQLEFHEPMIVLYSSGTTGQAKCIVHSVGGVVLSGHKESTLHRSVDHTSIQLQYTTTGWMMYLSAVQLLLMGARSIMFDGNPFYPKEENFIKLVAQEKVTHFGISPRYLQTLMAKDIVPKRVADLSNLKVVTSTGMLFSEKLFEWFYDTAFPPSVQLANISGGTDIVAAFGTANPNLPVYVGGCQCISLGMAAAAFDTTIEGGRGVKGRAVEEGTPGELVCTKAFPTMPAMFWGDTDGKRYFSSYFEKYDGVWTHGDFILFHPVTKQVLMLGRADGVLNPSGVRFGSSDIYNVIEASFADIVADSICVGQRRPQDDDERVMLFLMMQPGKKFTSSLVKQICETIRKQLSSRHVPSFVFETPEIPTTVNLKKVELPVKQIVSGKIVKPSGTLLNPKCLEYYYQFAKDEKLEAPPTARL